LRKQRIFHGEGVPLRKDQAQAPSRTKFLDKKAGKTVYQTYHTFTLYIKGIVMDWLDRMLGGIKRVLFRFDEILHVIVALLLIALVLCMAFYTITHFNVYSPVMVLKVIDDIMLMLIILELLWPVLRFLRKEPFSLGPFIYVGIISGVRRILSIEAKASIEHIQDSYHLIEIGVSVGVVLVLAVTLLLYQKSRKDCPFQDE
jgi:uncharacterized membrane protein (DUF373 family)